MSEFDSDKAALLSELDVERERLEKVLRGLSTADLTLARRGSWAVSKIVDHVLHSERLYTQLVSVFSGAPVAAAEAADLESGAAIVSALAASRKALLDAASAVREADFYRLQTIGHEEYSVLSILENVAAHDREHSEQIRKTLGAA
jgi:uncharacterized damage-inducible protein DinB